MLLWRREEEEEVIRWGFCSGAQALHGKDNTISTLERSDRAFVPFSFPWFQYLLTIRNMKTSPADQDNCSGGLILILMIPTLGPWKVFCLGLRGIHLGYRLVEEERSVL